MTRRWRARLFRASRGQLVIPALFVLPSLVLFIYLIFETEKLSREKIRHQFAVDTAAFVEMNNYSDLLNRSAYVNGAFPMRVFRESYPFGQTYVPPMNTTASGGATNPDSDMMEMMFKNGAFPDVESGGNAQPAGNTPPGDWDASPTWAIHYATDYNWCKACQVLNEGKGPADTGTQFIFRWKTADSYYLWYDGYALPMWNFWATVYQLLGTVENSQYQVFQSLTKPHTFFKKAWVLNTGESGQNANTDAWSRANLRMDCIYSSHSGTFGIVPQPPPLFFTPRGFGNDPDAHYKGGGGSAAQGAVHTGEGAFCPNGMFRVATVTSGLDNIRIQNGGVEIKQKWVAPANYFNVNVNAPTPAMVHVRVGITGCCVWNESGSPKPTPKFQTRELP